MVIPLLARCAAVSSAAALVGVVTSSSSEFRVALYLNNGTSNPFGGIAPLDISSDVLETSEAVLGDMDGDGDLDLVLGNGGQNRLYLNNGSGAFTDATNARLPLDNAFTNAVVLGDVDGDRDPDLVFGNSERSS